MVQPASQPPVRNPSGATTDPPYGPLAASGYGNPFFYHAFADDFDNALGSSTNGLYTISAGGAGTVVHTPGDGGLALFTTAGATNNFEAIQLPAASFTLPQGTTAGKKLFYLARLQLSDVTNSAFIAGLCNTTATPFTAIADGLYFNKVSGGTVLNLLSVIGSVTTTIAIPTSAYALVNAVSIDLAFHINRLGDVEAFVGSQLVGWIPQSGTGAVNGAGVPILPVLGKVTRNSGLTLTTANLNITLGVQTGAAVAKTMTADFHCVQKER